MTEESDIPLDPPADIIPQATTKVIASTGITYYFTCANCGRLKLWREIASATLPSIICYDCAYSDFPLG